MMNSTGHGEPEAGRGPRAVAAASAVAEGLALVAGALAELPAVQANCLPELERGRVAAVLSDGWNLAAFTPTGAVLLSVLDAGGASIEVVGGVPATWGQGRRGLGARLGGFEGEGRGAEGNRGVAAEGSRGDEGEGSRGDEGIGDAGDVHVPRATSHGAVRAALGAPPGRRIAAMGLVPGPDGMLIRMSCGLVLRLPAAALVEPVEVARILAWHAAMHAAERRGLPATPQLAAAIDELDVELSIPDRPSGRVAWASALAARVASELGFDALDTRLA